MASILTPPAPITTTLQPPAVVASTLTPQPVVESKLYTGLPGATGPQGPEGPQGPVGPQGPAGDLHYVHNQGVADTVWTISHNLGKYPSVTVVDSAGDEVEGSLNYNGLNIAVLTFSAAFSGKAFFN